MLMKYIFLQHLFVHEWTNLADVFIFFFLQFYLGFGLDRISFGSWDIPLLCMRENIL